MIRRGEKKDIDRILELLVQVDMVHHKGRPDIFKGPTTKYTREELEYLLKSEDMYIFVYVDKEVLGYAFCVKKEVLESNILKPIKTLYIDDICVDEKYRGSGIGSEIYNYVVMFAKKNGFYNITLNVWECNPKARKFYEKMGLVPQKTTMEKIL